MESRSSHKKLSLIEKANSTCAIVISYKQTKSIKVCILSLFNMKVRPGNIVVIDNSEENYYSNTATKLLCEEGISIDSYSFSKNRILEDIYFNNDELNKEQSLSYVHCPENNGYAAACNLGFAIAKQKKQRYCWILNADTQLRVDSFYELLNNVDIERYIAGSLILNSDYKIKNRVESCGAYGNLLRFKNDTSIPKEKCVNRFALHGCAMLISLKVYEKLDGMHEGFFMYGEETDFCIRAKKIGVKSLIITSSKITHISGESVKKTGINFWPLVYSNHIYLVRRNTNGIVGILFILILIIRHSLAVLIRGGIPRFIEFLKYISLSASQRKKNNVIKNILFSQIR